MDHGVFYSSIGPAEAWNGLTSIVEIPTDSDEKSRYIDGIKRGQRRPPGFFEGTIEAYSYPPSFYDHILTQRRHKSFSLSYRVDNAEGSKIHLIYNVLVSTPAYLHQQRDTDTISWKFTSLPVEMPNAARSSHLIIDTADAYSWTVDALEDILYGTDASPPRLPTPAEVFEIFEENSILRIIDHGDGTWTAIGPDSAIIMLDPTTFEITWPSAVYIDAVSYTISSL